VRDNPTPLTTYITYDGGVVKSDGSINLMISTQTLTGNSGPEGALETTLDEMRFYYYSGGWQYNVIGNVDYGFTYYWGAGRPFQYLNSNESFDDIIYLDFGSDHTVYKLRSTDNFATHTSEVLLAGNNLYKLGQCAYNTENEEDYLLITQYTNGNEFAVSTETSDDFGILKILHLASL
jgi:hypothetical protein